MIFSSEMQLSPLFHTFSGTCCKGASAKFFLSPMSTLTKNGDFQRIRPPTPPHRLSNSPLSFCPLQTKSNHWQGHFLRFAIPPDFRETTLITARIPNHCRFPPRGRALLDPSRLSTLDGHLNISSILFCDPDRPFDRFRHTLTDLHAPTPLAQSLPCLSVLTVRILLSQPEQ